VIWHDLRMESWQRLRSPEESPQVARLRARSTVLLERLATGGDRSGTVQRLVGLPALVVQLRRIAPAATSSAWVMQPQYAYDPEEPGVALTRAARMRGIETVLMTRPNTTRTHPLLSSIYPSTVLGPVFLRALIIDGRQAIIGGPDDLSGQRTSWYTTVPDIVDAVVDLWNATLPLCEPILPEGQQPPLTDRQLDVARLLCVGHEDAEIAELLRLAVHTVELEVKALLAELGARTRTEAVLNMRGRGVNGGWRNTWG
jgi:DNA-binding CsgD family transcriptional regulator